MATGSPVEGRCVNAGRYTPWCRSGERSAAEQPVVELLLGPVLLLLAAALAGAAAWLMTVGGAPRDSRPDAPDREADDAVAVLVLAASAVAVGSVGAAVLSSGEPSISALAPFLLPILLVLVGPLSAGARAARRRAGRRPRDRRRG